MSDAKPGPDYRWRKEQSSNFKSVEKRGRIVLLALGAVVLASIILGSMWLLGTARETSLNCYPYGKFTQALLSPAPWFIHDAAQLYQTFGIDDKKNTNSKMERSYLLPELRNFKDDTLLIYIAGRGMARENQAYVLPSDATDDPSTWISLADIIQALTESPSKRKLLLLDIAGTAPNLYTGPLKDSIADVIDDYLTKTPPPFTVLTSCSRGETSNVMAVLGASVFGHYLNQGLQGLANGFGGEQKDEHINVKELVSFVKSRVNRWASQNLGRTQTPKLYGAENANFLVAHRRKVAWLAESAKAVEPPATPDESKLSDQEKQEAKVKKEKQQKEDDQARLKLIFPEELEKNWKLYDPWVISLLQSSPRAGENRRDQNEFALRLATLNGFAHRLHQYEDTVMLFNSSGQTSQNQETQSLLANLNTSSARAAETLARIDNDTRPDHKPHSITALWPRNWLQQRSELPRDIPKDLVNEFEKLYQSLPGSTPAPAKAEAKVEDKKFLDLVAGKKDDKNSVPPLHLEALFLCWDTLCEDNRLTLGKLKFIDELMKKILADSLRDRLHARCNELDLLKWMIDQSEGDSEWNFVTSRETNKELERDYFEMMHQWLSMEYLAERCANGYLPDGAGFAGRQAALESAGKLHQSLVQKLLTEKKRKKYRPLSSEMIEYAGQLKAVSAEYTICLKDMDQERAALDAWWDAVAILQTTAEMMVSEDDSRRWQQWESLADNTVKLRPYLQAKSLDSSARATIAGVVQARSELVKSFNSLLADLLKSGDKDGEKLESSRGIERVLKSGLLTTADRKQLHSVLMKLQQKHHIDTINMEKGDVNGTGTVIPPLQSGLSTAEKAGRRAQISRKLLLLGGLSAMDHTGNVPTEEELRKAWTMVMPKLYADAIKNAQWLEAACIETVKPETDKTVALLQWRLNNSRPYRQWLEARQQQLEARQLHVADVWK